MTSTNMKNFIERRRSQGLCVLCGKPSENGAYRCNACREKRNEEKAKTRKMYQKCGVCPECRIHPIMGDEKLARNAMQNLAHKSMHVATRTESTIMSSTESIQEFCMPKGKNKESAQDAESGKLFWGGEARVAYALIKTGK